MTTATLVPMPATAARQVLDRLELAWNEGDGAAFAAPYSVDASFVTVRGQHIVGRAAIGVGHAGIFGNVYAGSTNRMRLVSTDEVAPGTVLAVSLHTLVVPAGPLAGRHQAFSTNLLTRAEDGCWQVASTHNTLVAA